MPITTVTPTIPTSEPTDIPVTEAGYHTGSSGANPGGLNADGARKLPARFAAEIRALSRQVGYTGDTAGASTHEGRIKANEALVTRSYPMTVLPGLRDLAITDAQLTSGWADHHYTTAISSGKLRITATAPGSDQMRRVYGLTDSGISGASEVKSTFAGADDSAWATTANYQVGHAHRITAAKQTLAPAQTAASATSTTIVGTGFTNQQFLSKLSGYRECYVQTVAGTGAGQKRRIINNTTTTITVDTAWSVTPDNTTVFEVYTFHTRAVVISGSVLVGFFGHEYFQMLTFDGGCWNIQNRTSLAPYVYSSGTTFKALPWSMKTRVVGNTVDLAIWIGADPEPAYGASGKSASWTIPDGEFCEPGMSGLYVAHLPDGGYVELDNAITTRL
jgi:hypothetical protein